MFKWRHFLKVSLEFCFTIFNESLKLCIKIIGDNKQADRCVNQ